MPEPLHQIFPWLNSGASSPLLTDLNTERKSMATGSRLLVGTARNKSWLFKSALICVSWRGDCLLGPVVTLLYQPGLFASSLPAWRSLALPFSCSLFCSISHGHVHKYACKHTFANPHTHIFLSNTFSSCLSQPFCSFSLSPFSLWLTHTLIPFLQGQASHGTSSE